MKVHSKIWWSPYYQNTYCLLCCINFMLLMIIMATPVWLQQHFNEDYVVIGIWSFCDESVCKELLLSEEAHLDTIRFFSILSFIFTLLAFISSRDFISRLVDTNIIEDLISSASNFCAGIFLLSLLLIVHFQLKTALDQIGKRTIPWWGFFGTCLICLHCFVLGTLSLLKYRSLVLKRLSRHSSGRVLSTGRIKGKASTQITVVPS
ncbi:uncharacterized protein LOC117669272 isoform X2 [Pantherophis guttatus]|uniref:Uncharacterized protein LOC117669272 isoform X2 n=1 Tax=Pantherophis guttatus TaxID=94885 RepID=A0ABM3ZNB8_PANGU|nr:uncharacterized protein LOC117669272 isoform X2 [Pantherophis guttatus]